jgi:hypothetical protein
MWIRSSYLPICCAPRRVSPDWVATSERACLEHLARGLAEPVRVEPDSVEVAPSSLQSASTFQHTFTFEPGQVNVGEPPEVLDDLADLLRLPDVSHVFLSGGSSSDEASSPEVAEQLRTARVEAIRAELIRRNVDAARLLVRSPREMEALRTDLSGAAIARLLAAPTVVVYGSPPKQPPPERLVLEDCHPGVLAQLSLDAAVVERLKRSVSPLTVTSCVAGACARAVLAIDSLGTGDQLVFGLEGQQGVGASLTWAAQVVLLQVWTSQTVARNGDDYRLRLQAGDWQSDRLHTKVIYSAKPSRRSPSGSCPIAHVTAVD